MCSESAFIERKEYVLSPPPEDDKGFELWQAQALTKYPSLLGAYDTLRKCWTTYHGGGK